MILEVVQAEDAVSVMVINSATLPDLVRINITQPEAVTHTIQLSS